MVWLEPRDTSKGVRWYVRWWHGGKQHSAPAGYTKQMAIKVRDNKERELLTGVPREQSIAAVYQEFLKYIRSSQRPNTLEIIERSCGAFVELHGHKLIVTQDDIKDYKQSLLSAYSKNGADMRFRTFRWFLSYAKIETDEAHIGQEKVARFLSRTEIQSLLKACRYNKELKDIVTVTLHTGLRRGEVLSLTHAQIHGKHLFVRQEKTDKDKVIPIQRTIEPIFNRAKIGPLFPGWKEDRLGRAFRRAVKRAKLGTVRFHDLRHTFASNWLKGGGDLASLSNVMGATLRVVKDTYAHFEPKQLKALIDGMDFM